MNILLYLKISVSTTELTIENSKIYKAKGICVHP